MIKNDLKAGILNDIRETAKLTGLPSIKCKDEAPLNETQRIFLSLPVRCGQAPDVQLQ